MLKRKTHPTQPHSGSSSSSNSSGSSYVPAESSGESPRSLLHDQSRSHSIAFNTNQQPATTPLFARQLQLASASATTASRPQSHPLQPTAIPKAQTTPPGSPSTQPSTATNTQPSQQPSASSQSSSQPASSNHELDQIFPEDLDPMSAFQHGLNLLQQEDSTMPQIAQQQQQLEFPQRRLFLPLKNGPPKKGEIKQRQFGNFAFWNLQPSAIQEVIDHTLQTFPESLFDKRSTFKVRANSASAAADQIVNSVQTKKPDWKKQVIIYAHRLADFALHEMEQSNITFQQFREQPEEMAMTSFLYFLSIIARPTISVRSTDSHKGKVCFAFLAFRAGISDPQFFNRKSLFSSKQVRAMNNHLQAVLCLKDYTKQSNPLFPQDVQRLTSVCNYDFFGLRDRLALHIMFNNALRTGSLVNCKPTDLKFYNIQSELTAQLTFRSQKGTIKREEMITTVTLTGEWGAMMKRYYLLFVKQCKLTNINLNSAPLFGFNSTPAFSTRIYRLCYFAGYPEQFFSGHSFRAGKVAFDTAETCSRTGDFSNFMSIVKANKFVGGWFGDKIKVYIRNHVTRFRESTRLPSEYTVEELHAPFNIRINPPAMANIYLNEINSFVAIGTSQHWYNCFGQNQFNKPFNKDKLNEVFEHSADFFNNNCQPFNELCNQECNSSFTPAKLLIWLVLATVINVGQFKQRQPEEAIALLSEDIATMPVDFRNVLRLLKRNEMMEQDSKYIPKVNLSNSTDQEAARANIANRRRKNLNFYE